MARDFTCVGLSFMLSTDLSCLMEPDSITCDKTDALTQV